MRYLKCMEDIMQKKIFFFLSLLIFIVFPVIGQAASFGDRVNTMSKIEQIRISTADEKVRIVLDASKPVSYKTFVLSNPNRVAIDIKGAWLSPEIIKETLVDSSCGTGLVGVTVGGYPSTTAGEFFCPTPKSSTIR